MGDGEGVWVWSENRSRHAVWPPRERPATRRSVPTVDARLEPQFKTVFASRPTFVSQNSQTAFSLARAGNMYSTCGFESLTLPSDSRDPE